MSGDRVDAVRALVAAVRRAGPAGTADVLDRIPGGFGATLRRAVAAAAHLLEPVEPADALADILVSRLAGTPEVAPYAAALRPRPKLINRWPATDAEPALRRVLRTGWFDRPGPEAVLPPVRAIAIDPGGRWLACPARGGTGRTGSGPDHQVWILDVATGRVRHRLAGHQGRVDALAVARDAGWLATASRASVRVWDLVTGEPLLAVPAGGSWPGLAAGPVGGWLAVLGDDGIRLLDPLSGHVRRELTGCRQPRVVAAAPDGTWVAAGDGDGAITIWDVAGGRVRSVLPAHQDAVRSLAVSGDGRRLVSGGDRTARIWDPRTGRRLRVLRPGGDIDEVAVSTDGRHLAIAGEGRVQVWPTGAGRPVQTLHGHAGDVQSLAFAPDGRWLAGGDDAGEVRLWTVAAAGGPARHGGGARAALAVAAAPDGRWIAVGREGAVETRDVAGGQVRRRYSVPGTARRVTTGPDGAWFAVAGSGHTIRLYDTRTGRVRVLDPDRHTTDALMLQDVHALGVAPDGTWLAAAGGNRKQWAAVTVWDIATATPRWYLCPHPGPVRGLAVAPDGTWFATAGGPAVLLWDAATGRCVRALEGGGAGEVGAVAVAPDGTWVAGARFDGAVCVWDSATGDLRATGTWVDGRIRAAALSRDGRLLATVGGIGEVRVWRMPDAVPVAAMRVDARLDDCCWLPDDGLCLAGGSGPHLFQYTAGHEGPPVRRG